MKVEDVNVQNRRICIRFHEKGGERHEMPCHHNLDTHLNAYIDGCGLASDPQGPLFRTIGPRTRTTPLPQANAYAIIRRRAASAGIETKIVKQRNRGLAETEGGAAIRGVAPQPH